MEEKNKKSGFQKGHHGYATPQSIKKVKASLKKFWTKEKREQARLDALKNGNGKWMIGKKHSLETIKKMKGRKAWNKGKRTPKKVRIKQSTSSKKHPNNALGKKWKIKNWGKRSGEEFHGLTYLQKLEKKANRKRPEGCEICISAKKISFDHNHVTGKFRGWICHRCNIALGKIKDNKKILKKRLKILSLRFILTEKLIKYLEKDEK